MTWFCWDLRWSLIGKGLKVYDCCCELGNGNGFDCGVGGWWEWMWGLGIGGFAEKVFRVSKKGFD